MPNNADMLGMLNNMEQINSLLAATGTALPANWSSMPPNDKQNFLTQLMTQSEKAQGVAQVIDQNARRQKDMVTEMGQQGVQVQTDLMPTASKKFNLKKAQMMPAMPMQQAQPPVQDAMQVEQQPEQFQDASQLKQWLENIGDPNVAIETLRKKYTNSNQIVTDPATHASEEALGVIKDAINAFFSTDDEQQKLEAASKLFDIILPEDAKTQDSGQNAIPAQMETGVQPHVAKLVEETNNAIKKLAEEIAKKKTAGAKTVFNLKKVAQHQTLQNVITFGPGQTKVDAFTGQQISNWHLIERNKGFGLKIDDVLDIDFEAIWRGNIMDKYYSPYRDKEGNWVGGYIENRFEVDKNIPPLNNYQLKPGEKRKPYVPEYSLTEARLESSRDKMNTERGYEPSESGKVFNWKEASKKKVNTKFASISESDISMEIVAANNRSNVENAVSGADKDEAKTAQLKPLQPPTLPGEKTLNTTPTEKCPICKGDVVQGAVQCKNCGANIKQREMGKVKTGPDQRGQQMTPAPSVPYNARLSSVLSAADAIFYDGQHFIVYANRQKERFDSFDEAEAFKSAQLMPQPAIQRPVKQKVAPAVNPTVKRTPVQPKPINPVDIQKRQEKHETAHGLAIDG